MTAMRCSAALSCRLPERVIRTRPAVLPDHTGIGATPPWRAKAASLLNRVTPAVSPTSLGRGQRPAARHRQQCRRDLADAFADPLGQLVDRLGEADDVGELVAGELGHEPGCGVQPVAEQPAMLGQVQRRAVSAPVLGIEFMNPPQQPVDRRSALPDKVFRRSTSSFNSRDTSS